jgi:hypothetical protein
MFESYFTCSTTIVCLKCMFTVTSQLPVGHLCYTHQLFPLLLIRDTVRTLESSAVAIWISFKHHIFYGIHKLNTVLQECHKFRLKFSYVLCQTGQQFKIT